MSHTPDLTGSVVLRRDSVAVVEIDTYPNRSPIGALRLGHLTLQADNPIALDRLSEAAGEAADKLRAAQPGHPSYDGAERDAADALRELQRHLRDEETVAALRDLCPRHDLDEIRGRADDLMRLASNLRAACEAVAREREPSNRPASIASFRVRGEP